MQSGSPDEIRSSDNSTLGPSQIATDQQLEDIDSDISDSRAEALMLEDFEDSPESQNGNEECESSDEESQSGAEDSTGNQTNAEDSIPGHAAQDVSDGVHLTASEGQNLGDVDDNWDHEDGSPPPQNDGRDVQSPEGSTRQADMTKGQTPHVRTGVTTSQLERGGRQDGRLWQRARPPQHLI